MEKKSLRQVKLKIERTFEKVYTMHQIYQKGKLLEACDFIALRPENGLSPMSLDDFIGKSLKQDVHKLQLVNKNDFI